MSGVYEGLEPQEVWKHFLAINAIPRPSGMEGQARSYVEQVAEAHGAAFQTDARGNTVVRVLGKPGHEDVPAVVIQAHLDMVCEKRPGVVHDFRMDPIRPRIENGIVYATGTTLGADNGIGAACALALLSQPGLVHGPLELLFTVEEETGLYGAIGLDPDLISARLMVNLDSEDPKELTVGCAGGGGAVVKLPVETHAVPQGWIARRVVVAGLKGGHSGVQIHERLANAIKLLTAVLLEIRDAVPEFHLASVHGGNAHNAIPRDASAVVCIPPDAEGALATAVTRAAEVMREQWLPDEPGLEIGIVPEAAPPEVLSETSRDTLLTLLHQLPHGVLTWSHAFPGKVETSSNLAQVNTSLPIIEIGTSTRSFVTSELNRIQEAILRLGDGLGATVEIRDGYPGWQPNPNSRLLEITKRVYEREFGKPAEVQVIHAGLECGVIVDKLPGAEAISFGPRIEGAHTPEEHVYPETVAQTWKLLTALLAEIS